MKKNKILILLSIFLITGCQADYNIVIDENTVKEELSAYETNMSKWNVIQGNNILTYQQYQQNYKDAPVGIYYDDQNVDNEIGFNENRQYYKIDLLNENSKKGLIFNANFNVNKYNDSYIARNCYKHINVLSQGNEISISTSNELTCMNYIDGLEKVVINITTNYKVIDTNATNIKDNTYSWVITKNNYTNSSIYLKLTKNSSSSEPSSNNNKKDSFNFQMIYAIIIIVILLIAFLIYKKFKKNSEEQNKI